MPGLTLTIRKDTGALTISGRIAGKRVQRRAQSDNPKLAREEARLLEAELLREAYHGPRRGVRTFAFAAAQYILALHPRPATIARLDKLTRAIGPKSLAEIDQQEINRLASTLLGRRRPPAAATIVREVTTPVRAVLNYAVEQNWCDPRRFRQGKMPRGRTLYLLPQEAEALRAAAAPHLQPLLTFLLCTGARMSEALELDWADVKLGQGLVTFWHTKSGEQTGEGEGRARHARLSPRAVAALANLGQREGRVFLWQPRRPGAPWRPYTDKDRDSGGQIKTAWRGAVARAGLTARGLTPHGLRHTWATWHHAIHKDLLKLQFDGGWAELKMVTRYAHRMPEGYTGAIEAFWGAAPRIEDAKATA